MDLMFFDIFAIKNINDISFFRYLIRFEPTQFLKQYCPLVRTLVLERITVLDNNAFTTDSLAPRTTGWGTYKLGQCQTPAIIPIFIPTLYKRWFLIEIIFLFLEYFSKFRIQSNYQVLSNLQSKFWNSEFRIKFWKKNVHLTQSTV